MRGQLEIVSINIYHLKTPICQILIENTQVLYKTNSKKRLEILKVLIIKTKKTRRESFKCI